MIRAFRKYRAMGAKVDKMQFKRDDVVRDAFPAGYECLFKRPHMRKAARALIVGRPYLDTTGHKVRIQNIKTGRVYEIKTRYICDVYLPEGGVK